MCHSSAKTNNQFVWLDCFQSKMHGVNAVLHALACWLVAHWTRRISAGCGETTWSTALLFACHPVHTEAVAGLVGRAELLAACLSLIAILVEVTTTTTHQLIN